MKKVDKFHRHEVMDRCAFICDIIEEENKFSVYIKKKKDVLPWKDFKKSMAVSVEYNLEY